MNFKVGDRVAVYSYGDPLGDGQVAAQRDLATIQAVRSEGLILLFDAASGAVSKVLWHPKQCRRLVKKPRRRIWVLAIDLNTPPNRKNMFVCTNCESKTSGEWIEFVEVKRK